MDVLLISPNEVKATTNINYNVSDAKIARAIEVAQETYLKEIIGKNLLDRLKELESNAIKGLPDSMDDAENAVYKTLKEEYVDKYLSAKAQVEILVPISFDIRNIGAGATKSDINIVQTNIQNVNYMRDYYETQSVDKANQIIKFLRDNKDAYVELDGCVCTASKLGHLKANTGLWLGNK